MPCGSDLPLPGAVFGLPLLPAAAVVLGVCLRGGGLLAPAARFPAVFLRVVFLLAIGSPALRRRGHPTEMAARCRPPIR